MSKALMAVLMAVTLLVGCQAKPEVVPVVEKFDPAKVLAQPPAAAMVDPVEPTPLKYGASNSENSAIMKTNNLNAANDRSKLRTLQQYVRNIFNPQK
ncbi:Rz-like spanin [Salmonella phage SPLA5a]|nr:Rz-like spanin [Salmonella phage SPLA5a]